MYGALTQGLTGMPVLVVPHDAAPPLPLRTALLALEGLHLHPDPLAAASHLRASFPNELGAALVAASELAAIFHPTGAFVRWQPLGEVLHRPGLVTTAAPLQEHTQPGVAASLIDRAHPQFVERARAVRPKHGQHFLDAKFVLLERVVKQRGLPHRRKLPPIAGDSYILDSKGAILAIGANVVTGPGNLVARGAPDVALHDVGDFAGRRAAPVHDDPS